MLCANCQNVFCGQFIEDRSEYANHHLHPQSFARAISQKCYICTSMLHRYQGDGRSTLDPLQLAEVLKATQYYFIAEDDVPRLTLMITTYGEYYDEAITWYDDYDSEWHTSCTNSVAVPFALLRQNRRRGHSNLRLTRHQNLVASWPNVGCRPV